MSSKGIFKVECPHCGEEFDAHCWTIVKGDEDSEIKELIFNGEFDLLMCSKCQNIFRHEEPFLYIDDSKEILAFVMPEGYAAEKDKWMDKMTSDYEELKASFTGSEGYNFKPQFMFGVDELQQLITKDQEREEETEVIEFLAREAGFHIAQIKPTQSRLLDIPFSMPMPVDSKKTGDVLNAVREIIKINSSLPSLIKLGLVLETLPDENIPFLK